MLDKNFIPFWIGFLERDYCIPVIQTSHGDPTVDTSLATSITAPGDRQMNEKTSVFLKTILRDRWTNTYPDSSGIRQIPKSGMDEWNDGHNGAFSTNDTIKMAEIVWIPLDILPLKDASDPFFDFALYKRLSDIAKTPSL